MRSCRITQGAQHGALWWPTGVGWEKGREAQERRVVCIINADSRILWQKPTQHYKAVFLRLKKRERERGREKFRRRRKRKWKKNSNKNFHVLSLLNADLDLFDIMDFLDYEHYRIFIQEKYLFLKLRKGTVQCLINFNIWIFLVTGN